MLVVAEPSYRATQWYARLLPAIKALARKKRAVLTETERAEDVRPDEGVAFVLGGGERWVTEAVRLLQSRGVHPILLNELPDGALLGRCSRVRTDFARLCARIARDGEGAAALYGVNPRSASDGARRNAFLSVFRAGAVFENRGSLAACFEEFSAHHALTPYASVIAANELAAVSLVLHLRRRGTLLPVITVASGAQILAHFPEIRAVGVDPASIAAAAFSIADCVRQNPDFCGVEITVDYPARMPDGTDATVLLGEERTKDAIYEDGELCELMRIEQLLSECDDTDRTILHLLCQNRTDIASEAYLSDNGVKYRIKKMKRIMGVESKREIPVLLEKYGITL